MTSVHERIRDLLSLAWCGRGTLYRASWVAQRARISLVDADDALRAGVEAGLLSVETSIVEKNGDPGPLLTEEDRLDDSTWIHPETGEEWSASDVMVALVSTPALDEYAAVFQGPPATWVAQWQTFWACLGYYLDEVVAQRPDGWSDALGRY